MSLAFCCGPAALAAFPPAPARQPSLAPAQVWLALARRALGANSPAEALRCFEAALRHDASLTLARLGRAMCLAQLGRDDEAQAAAQGADADALYLLAKACARDGRVGSAAGFLAEAVAQSPGLEARAGADRDFADHPAYLQTLGRL